MQIVVDSDLGCVRSASKLAGKAHNGSDKASSYETAHHDQNVAELLRYGYVLADRRVLYIARFSFTVNLPWRCKMKVVLRHVNRVTCLV